MGEVAITKILQLRCCDPRDAAAMQTFNLAQKVAIYTMGKKGSKSDRPVTKQTYWISTNNRVSQK